MSSQGNGVTKYDLLEQEIDQLKDTIHELKSDVKSLKEDIEDIKDDIDKMHNDIGEVKYDISKLSDEINSLKKAIESTTGRLNLLTWAVFGLFALMIVIVLWNFVAMLLMPHAAGQMAQQGVQQGMQIGVVKVGEQHAVNPPGAINPGG